MGDNIRVLSDMQYAVDVVERCLAYIQYGMLLNQLTRSMPTSAKTF